MAIRTTFVVDNHVIDVAWDDSEAPRSGVVNLRLDGSEIATFIEPGWLSPRFGMFNRTFYWWSARRLVVLPVDAPDKLEQIDADEDLIVVFGQPTGWLLVCETSIRLVNNGLEVSRLEFGEVLVDAQFDCREIIVRDFHGVVKRAMISNGNLTPVD